MDWNDAPFWLAFGLLGNLAFFSRFLVQWIASERARQSYIPISFWYLSLAGSVILLIYAIHRRDPIFTLAYLPNSVVYVRNLVLLRRGGGDGSPPGLTIPRTPGRTCDRAAPHDDAGTPAAPGE
jgi:lipid-A-disaccharide synthase-like uncharacterized protein